MRTASGAVLHRSHRRDEMVHISHNPLPSQRRSLGVDLIFYPSPLNAPRNQPPRLYCIDVLFSVSGFLVLRDLSGLHNLGYIENNPYRGP